MQYVKRNMLGGELGLFATTCLAGPITINIPVNLSNMHPDVHGFSIDCRIKVEAGRDFESARSTSLTPISGGRYSGR